MFISRLLRSPSARTVLLGLLVCLCAACDSSQPASTTANTAPKDSGALAIGAVGDARISLENVKEPIRLQLYDLDLRRYRMLRQGLESIVLGRMDADGEPPRSAEVWLQPPLPPRLEVSDDGERIRPGGGSPVTIVAFCNMESPHCARLQLHLSRILPLFGTLVHYASRDMILPFHRHAESAAEAGHCALEQDKYWTFHDFMYAASPPPDRQSIQRAARAAQLDLGLFDSCLASARQRPSVAADAALARALGVDTVPAVFVNGLYAGVNPGAEQLIWLIETELKRLDIASPRQVEAQRESREALQLVALIHSRQPGQGLAMMAPVAAPDRVRSYREGENPLWNALQSEDEVRLRVMRKGGLASHFTYRFVD